MPHIITSIEGKLGISIHESPTIHLIVYIPPCDSSPLHLYDSKGQKFNNHSVDSFLSLKWGGIIISNPTREECSKWMSNQEKAEVTVNSHNIMHTALFMLRRIADIHVDVISIEFTVKFGKINKNFLVCIYRQLYQVQILFHGKQ